MQTNDQKHTPVRCDENDPHRCDAPTKLGQCTFLAVPGSKQCPIHNMHNHNLEEQKGLFSFRRVEVANRVKEMKDHPDARKLQTELATLRFMLEGMINKAEDDYDLIINFGPQVQGLIKEIRSTLEVNVKLEEKIGTLLTIEDVSRFANALLSIIIAYIDDPEVLAKISDDFNAVLNKNPRELAEQAVLPEPVKPEFIGDPNEPGFIIELEAQKD